MRSLEDVMMSNMMRKRKKQGGFTFMELMVALIIVIVLVAVVILVTRGFFSKARESALDVDLHSVKTAVDAYVLQAGEWPTANGSLPPTGQYALIDFNASFRQRWEDYELLSSLYLQAAATLG